MTLEASSRRSPECKHGNSYASPHTSPTSHFFAQIRSVHTSISNEYCMPLMTFNFVAGETAWLRRSHELVVRRGRVAVISTNTITIISTKNPTDSHAAAQQPIPISITSKMAITDVADEYFAYDNRLASFQNAQHLSKRRASNASTKAHKSMRWPHKWLSSEEVWSLSIVFYLC